MRVVVPTSPERVYEVVVERGALDGLGDLVSGAMPAHRYALIADSRVAALHSAAALNSLSDAGLDARLFVFPAGEWNKSRSAWAALGEQLLESGFGRDSAIIALGGGVTGDLAGFVAATYMRGIPFTTVPTTLLSMVDASVGGKTGLDTERAKNAIGAFHHPNCVLIDPDLLATLPKPHLRAGLAEAVKTAAIRDGALFAWIEAHQAALASGDAAPITELVRACVAIKAEVVSTDPAESGLRQVLNFGHTAGHALEALSGLALLHGEAVAAGMRVEARLGEAVGVTEPGTTERLEAALDGCRVPNLLDGTIGARALLDAAAGDKKNRRGRPHWVLLRRIGEVAVHDGGTWSIALDDESLEERVEAALRAASDPAHSAP